MTLKTIKTLNPDAKGTKKLVNIYGDKLVYVRYRHDYNRKRKLKTVEIIVDDAPLNPKPSKIPMNKIMNLSVAYGEVHIGKLIKSVGGKWNHEDKVWELPYREVLALGLEERIVNKSSV